MRRKFSLLSLTGLARDILVGVGDKSWGRPQGRCGGPARSAVGVGQSVFYFLILYFFFFFPQPLFLGEPSIPVPRANFNFLGLACSG